MKNSPIVINLFGVPGASKSTGAAYIFSKLKMANINAELITEFAKGKVWEKNSEVFRPDNQCYIFGKQFYNMSRCKDKVDIIVTDAPLPMSIVYNQSDMLGETFNTTVMNCFNSFNNVSYLLTRDKPYNPKGRYQSEKESNQLYPTLVKVLTERKIPFETLKGNEQSYDKIVSDTIARFNEYKST